MSSDDDSNSLKVRVANDTQYHVPLYFLRQKCKWEQLRPSVGNTPEEYDMKHVHEETFNKFVEWLYTSKHPWADKAEEPVVDEVLEMLTIAVAWEIPRLFNHTLRTLASHSKCLELRPSDLHSTIHFCSRYATTDEPVDYLMMLIARRILDYDGEDANMTTAGLHLFEQEDEKNLDEVIFKSYNKAMCALVRELHWEEAGFLRPLCVEWYLMYERD